MSTTDTFRIVLQNGIIGGFAPPTPNALYTIDHTANSDVFSITTQVRPHGTPSLLPPKIKELKIADHISDITTLQHLLRQVPPQYPGAQDLYDRNTSIVQLASSEEFRPSGLVAGNEIPHPTEEQKVQFGQAVEIIEKLVVA